MIRILFGLALTVLAPSWVAAEGKPLAKIAFGSCANQEKPMPIWKSIVAQKPDLFLWLGDNIYADTDDMEVMRKKYQKLANEEGYQQLTKTCPILATWDDHDYGKNDAGVEYSKKAESQQVFLDFFNVPQNSPRRSQQGIYHSQVFGPDGKRVQVIMLDGRYFRSPLRRGKREEGMTYTPYIASQDPDATILGAEQWKWLEEELKKPAELRLIVSGIQVVAEDHGFEKWMNFPLERERLFRLIRDSKATGVICLSGDRHLAELSLMDKAVGYPLYDLTSSGLNQGFKNWRMIEKNRHRVASMQYGDNFGMIAIDWQDDPKISLQIRDEVGEVVMQQKIALSLLQFQEALVMQDTKKEGKKDEAKKDEQPKPKDGAITPKEAMEKVGQKVTVEMKVNSTGASGPLMFLNSEKNRREKTNFTIVIPPEGRKGKWKDAEQNTFFNKTIRVTGTVAMFKDTVQIKIEKDDDLELVEKK